MSYTLVVDIGNSRVKWARARAHALSDVGAAAHDGDVGACLERAWASLLPPARAVLACVAGATATATAQRWIETHWHQTPLLVQAGADGHGIRNLYDTPEQLGADRWAALIGAWRLRAGAQCVIDCGTVVSLSVLDASGGFVGGALMPGLATARACLYARTPLPLTPGNGAHALARNTADAVTAGTLFGTAGAIERLLVEYRARVDADLPAVLTGGDAETLAAQVGGAVSVVPDLVLRGLAHIAEARA